MHTHRFSRSVAAYLLKQLFADYRPANWTHDEVLEAVLAIMNNTEPEPK